MNSKEPCFATGDGIICAGLPRSGTSSLAAALTILGLGPVHHALQMTDVREIYGWGQAAWCNIPYLRKSKLHGSMDRLPFYLNPADALLPWTRADWDRLIGRKRVTTDVGSLFSEQLITAYPEAKVILVERPLDRWMTSFGGIIIDSVCAGFSKLLLSDLGPWAGYPRPRIVRDITMGWLQADSRETAWKRMPIAHKEHSAMVRKMVPAEQLLEFKHEDGWEPLCRFFDVPIPDVPFPHINDKVEFLGYLGVIRKKILYAIVKRVGYWTLVFGAVGVALRHGAGQWLVDAVSRLLMVRGTY